MTTAQDGGKVVSLTHRSHFPQEMLLVLVSFRGWVDPRVIVRSEGFYVNEKFHWYHLGSNQRFVAQHLNHCATAVPFCLIHLSHIGFYNRSGEFYVLLTVHPCIIFFKWSQLGAHYFLVYLFKLLYMFRATTCPSSGELTVSMRHWYFSLCIGGCLHLSIFS